MPAVRGHWQIGHEGEGVSLACITPTRRRFNALLEQAKAIGPQLGSDDLWIVGDHGGFIECDHWALLANEIPFGCLEVAILRGHTETVNRLRNALAAFAPPSHDLVEVDDHDPLSPYALSEIRHALEAGYDYVFGWHDQRVQIEAGGEFEAWPAVERTYSPGDFAAGKIDALAVRAIRRSLWNRLGGWSEVWPAGHKDLATRAEASGASIICLQQPLCCVTVEPEDSMCAIAHRLAGTPGF